MPQSVQPFSIGGQLCSDCRTSPNSKFLLTTIRLWTPQGSPYQVVPHEDADVLEADGVIAAVA